MARIVRAWPYGQAAGERRPVGGGGAAVAPAPPPRPLQAGAAAGARPGLSDRACLTGIVFVLKTGAHWASLPQELGCGSGMTCWRRLRDWHRAGLWRGLHRVLLQRLVGAGKI